MKPAENQSPATPTARQEIFEEFREHRHRNLGRLFMMGKRRYAAFVERRMLEAGHPDIKTGMFAIMAHLDLDGNTMVDLSKRIHCTKQAVSKMVKDLETLGYLDVAPHPTDARSGMVQFTEKGISLLHVANGCMAEIEGFLGTHLSEVEIATLLTLLTKVVNLDWEGIEENGDFY